MLTRTTSPAFAAATVPSLYADVPEPPLPWLDLWKTLAAAIAPLLESPHLGEAIAPHYRTPTPSARLAGEARHRREHTAGRGREISSLDCPLVHRVHGAPHSAVPAWTWSTTDPLRGP